MTSTNSMSNKPWRQSASGIKIYPLHPELTEIRLDDIRTAYRNIRRWGGQYDITLGAHCHACKYSLKSVVHNLIDVPKSLSAYAYLHDAHEAYIGDVPSPCGANLFFKRDEESISLAQLKEEWDARIFGVLGIDVTTEDKLIVDKIDKIGGRVEAICFTRNVDKWAKITEDELPIAERYLCSLLTFTKASFNEQVRLCRKLLASIKD